MDIFRNKQDGSKVEVTGRDLFTLQTERSPLRIAQKNRPAISKS
jgi:hypothetical protein